jgi:exopolysaccharide production protein ExoQ
MGKLIGTAVCTAFIYWIFVIARDRTVRTSKALWIVVMWLANASSRNLSEWLHLSQPDSSDRYLEGSPVDRVYLFGLIVFGVIALIGRRHRVMAILQTNKAILLYFFYCGFSMIWSDYPDVSGKRWIRAIGDLVMVLIILTDSDWLTALKRSFARVGFVVIPLSILFVRYFPEWGRSYSRGGQPAWTGVTTDKNALGMICLIYGLAFTWSFLHTWKFPRGRRRSRLLVAYGILASMAIWLIQQSNSATSLACWMIAGGIMVLTRLSHRARKPAVLHLLVWGALSGIVLAMFFNTGSGLVQTLGRDSTFTGRTAIWNAALPLIPNPILGAGYESFWLGPRLLKVERMINQGLNEAHNGYIEIYLNLGWLGIVIFIGLMVTGYRTIVASVRRQADASTLMLAYFVAGAMYNVSEAGFKMMNPVWICFMLAIIEVRRQRPQESTIDAGVAPGIVATSQWAG